MWSISSNAIFAFTKKMQGSCVWTTEQSLALFLMALTPNDVSRLLTGPLTPHSCAYFSLHFHVCVKFNCSWHICRVAFLRLVREQLALVYRLRPAPAASAEPDGAGEAEASGDADDEDKEDGSRKAKRARSSYRSATSTSRTLLAVSTPKLLVSCIGLGLSNIARAQLWEFILDSYFMLSTIKTFDISHQSMGRLLLIRLLSGWQL